MDEIMRQEKHHLSEVITAVDNSVAQLEKQYHDTKSRTKDPCYDLDDLQTKQYYLAEADKLKFRIDEETSHRDSPYFAHMELDYRPSSKSEISKTKDVYVGKPGFTAGSNIIVDWRAPLGQIYYQKAQRDFIIKEQSYTLLMRRSLQISHGELFRYNTEYDVDDVSLEGRIVDPFLMTVLKDKRRQHRLTDIIATIQENQNTIIARPYHENFVVQGCAGSGKTMILLHRLSYLLFNNKNLRPDRIKIITPNLYFSTFIDDLSEELGLHEIQRLTVEEYYVRVIHAYSGKIDVKTKITSEMELPSEFLEEIYSEEFLRKVRKHYDDFCEEKLSGIDAGQLQKLASKIGDFTIPDLNIHKYDRFHFVEQLLLSLAANFKNAIANRNKWKSTVENSEITLQKKQKVLEEKTVQFKLLSDGIIEQLETIRSDAEAYIPKAQDQKNELDEKLKICQSVLQNSVEEVQTIEKRLADAREAALDCTDFESVSSHNSELSNYILEANQDTTAEIRKVQEELTKIPFFNFTKRNRLSKTQAQLYSQFQSSIEKASSEFILRLEAELEQKKSALPELPEDFNSIQNLATSINRRLQRSKDIIAAITDTLRVLVETPEIEINTAISQEEYSLLEKVLKRHTAAHQEINELDSEVKNLQTILQYNREHLEEAERNVPADEEQKAVSTAQNTLADLQFQNIRERVLAFELNAIAERYGVKKTKQYRHDLYLLLAFCTMYFTKPNLNDSFLNIDEAQDLAVTEYKILHQALGSGCIYNLYGDVNQLVYDYKGIWDWEDISDITGGKLFVLNENYRNTLQITNYCNTVFGAEVYPIGISGEAVEELPLADAIEKFKTESKKNSSMRAAVLISNSDRNNTVLQDLFFGSGFHWLEPTASGISVLTAEMAKGLEFDRVLVVESNMNENEQYISFTRAMEKLIVAK